MTTWAGDCPLLLKERAPDDEALPEKGTVPFSSGPRSEKGTVPFSVTGRFVPRALGTGPHTFAERLSRARLLYARRREATFNWLALSVAMFIVLAASSIEDHCVDTTREGGMRCLQATEMQ